MMDEQMKSFLFGIAGALLVLILAAVLIPFYSDYSDRAITGEILISVKELQGDIEKQLIHKEPVTVSTNKAVKESQYISNIKVLNDGTIRIKGGKIGQVIILVPEVIDDKLVNWECIGGPDQAMPINCKSA
jgi:hypothetical protein